MSAWGARQQVKYISSIILIAIVLAAYPVYKIFLDKKPSCFDGKQNQNEAGIDCGGVCQKICQADSLIPIVLYARIFQIAPGSFSAVANIENPNATLLAQNVPYSFKIYDSHDALIAENYGATFVPPNMIFPIFVGPLDTGNRIPAKVAFQFENYPVWRKASSSVPILKVLNENLTATDTAPHLEASLQNPTPYDLKNIEVIALIYDANNSLLAASRTVVDSLGRSQSAPLVFTWTAPFSAPVSRIDVVPNIPLADYIPNK